MINEQYYCDTCMGHGMWYEPHVTGYGEYYETVCTCRECGGSGLNKAKIMSIITDESIIESRERSDSQAR